MTEPHCVSKSERGGTRWRKASSHPCGQFDRFKDRGVIVLGLLTRAEIGHVRIGSAGCLYGPADYRASVRRPPLRGSTASDHEFLPPVHSRP
jgi:hypothetical protein